jgi:glycine dehydrogenase
MIAIRDEIRAVEAGKIKAEDTALRHAPHTAMDIAGEWNRPYTREEAAFPVKSLKNGSKYWPPVGRVDNVYGDRNVVCSCPPLSDYA